MHICRAWISGAFLLLPAGASAQTATQVIYDHYLNCKNTLAKRQDGCTVNYTRRLDPGGTLKIIVTNSREGYFTVAIRGYTVLEQTPELRVAREEELAKSPTDTLPAEEITHNAKYAGYIVTISPKGTLPEEKPPKDPATGAGAVKMPGPAMLVVTIDVEDPPYAFTGGVSLTSLRSQAFVARAATGGAFTITTDPARRDAGTVGFATFVNVRLKQEWGRWWPGVGIGLETDGNTQYYFGLGYQFANGMFLNGGAVLGQVATLPAGLQLDDIIDDPNRLSNLDSRRRFGVYVGLSFKFLGGGQTAFGRPFLGAEEK
jgi:hypothetical protein